MLTAAIEEIVEKPIRLGYFGEHEKYFDYATVTGVERGSVVSSICVHRSLEMLTVTSANMQGYIVGWRTGARYLMDEAIMPHKFVSEIASIRIDKMAGAPRSNDLCFFAGRIEQMFPLRRLPLLLVAMTVISMEGARATTSSDWYTTYTIDNFSVDQQELGGNEDQFNSMNGTMMGGNRDQVYVNFEYGNGNWENISGGAWSGYGDLGSGTFALQYDGADETKELATSGLGSIDLTVNGGSAFELAIWSEWGGEVSVLVYSNNGTRTSSATLALQSDLNKSYYYYMPFFAMDGDCDFARVGAVELSFPYSSISMSTHSFAVARDTNQPQQSPAATPTPTRTPATMPSPSRSPSPTSSYIMPAAGPTQELDFGFPITVSVSSSVEASFQTEQIDSSSVSSISFAGTTASQVHPPCYSIEYQQE